MSGALYMAASGAMNHQVNLTVLANNLSNMHTAGFKKDQAVFRVPELSPEDAGQRQNFPPPDASNRHYSLVPTYTRTDFTPGRLNYSANKLDLALQGNGFFCVETPGGIGYTRKGDFTLDGEGRLITSEGYPVLGEGGPITLEDNAPLIDSEGQVFADGAVVDTLKVVEFEDVTRLRKVDNTLFATVDDDVVAAEAQATSVHQGYLELSNVEPVAVMAEMITVLRGYESYQKVIRSIDEITAKAISEVGKLS
jgi:flagellar basal-body rod protein FlgG